MIDVQKLTRKTEQFLNEVKFFEKGLDGPKLYRIFRPLSIRYFDLMTLKYHIKHEYFHQLIFDTLNDVKKTSNPKDVDSIYNSLIRKLTADYKDKVKKEPKYVNNSEFQKKYYQSLDLYVHYIKLLEKIKKDSKLESENSKKAPEKDKRLLERVKYNNRNRNPLKYKNEPIFRKPIKNEQLKELYNIFVKFIDQNKSNFTFNSFKSLLTDHRKEHVKIIPKPKMGSTLFFFFEALRKKGLIHKQYHHVLQQNDVFYGKESENLTLSNYILTMGNKKYLEYKKQGFACFQAAFQGEIEKFITILNILK